MEQDKAYFLEATQAMEKLYGQDVPMSLATVDLGKPNIRVIDVYFLGGAFYAVTYSESHKMREIAIDPHVALNHELFVARGEGENIGHPQAKGNEALRVELQRAFYKFYTRHVNEGDPNTCILKITPAWALVFANDCKYVLDFVNKTATRQHFVVDIIV
jgi:general stress protein 26